MSNINTGGPAFPCDEIVDKYGSITRSSGMTLRDYFAAKAMQGDLIGGVHEDYFAATAMRVYKMADAMLKAREA